VLFLRRLASMQPDALDVARACGSMTSSRFSTLRKRSSRVGNR
jgi:hypothetical protein